MQPREEGNFRKTKKIWLPMMMNAALKMIPFEMKLEKRGDLKMKVMRRTPLGKGIIPKRRLMRKKAQMKKKGSLEMRLMERQVDLEWRRP